MNYAADTFPLIEEILKASVPNQFILTLVEKDSMYQTKQIRIKLKEGSPYRYLFLSASTNPRVNTGAYAAYRPEWSYTGYTGTPSHYLRKYWDRLPEGVQEVLIYNLDKLK